MKLLPKIGLGSNMQGWHAWSDSNRHVCSRLIPCK